ncbi:MAG: iron-sulfur cluster assembly scaffold protein [Clostridium sp.]|uniref:iron-sulfur cluster assembly scaffold protein n=1 Tax=Clostridium sp. TaxID=1506 RepID=UPI002FC7DC3B
MSASGYTDKVMDHFISPRNVGSLRGSNGRGKYGDPGCGDSLEVHIKVVNNVIEDMKYFVFGCPASIATSSMTTVLAKGKTLEEALKITDEDVIEALGGLPEAKKHCSNLGVTALRNAIDDYYKNHSK